MREIKFRGKTKSDGKWITGMPTYDLGYIFNDTQLDSCDRYEIIPETVGQFTGQKDKNGVEIYEGDIWKWNEDEVIYQIDFCQGSFGAYAHGYHRQPGLFKFGEIIGNIHDNPELL